MKKLILIILPVALIVGQSFGQSEPIGNPDNGIQLGVTGAYMFGGSIRTYDGEIKAEDGFSYGVTLSKVVQPGATVELSWNSLQTTATGRFFNEIGTTTNDLNVNYILVNYLQSWRAGTDQVEPYGILGVGVSIFGLDSEQYGSNSEVFFSAAFGIGSKFYLNDRLGIKIHGRMLLPMTFGGGSLWCGTGGCGIGVNSYSSFLQGDLGGGLFLRF